MTTDNSSSNVLQNALNRGSQILSSAQKRPLLQEDFFPNDFPPSKRVNYAYNNMSQPGLYSENSVEIIQIPENSVGLVIGRGGEQISLIQQQTNCRVQMASDKESSGIGTRACTLQGSKICIDKAREMINEVLERNRTINNTNHSNLFETGTIPQNHVALELLIPGSKCGLVIGKNGETIKSIQENIGIKMLLIQDSQSISMGPKPLRLLGSPTKVEQAKRVIEQLIGGNDDSGGNSHYQLRSGGPRSVGEVIVPRSSVGFIIGKRGETIKRLANDSGAKIQFKPDDNLNTQDRCAIIQGTPEQINLATQMISDLVTRNGPNASPIEVFFMHIPANKTGLVIGKNGDTIKQICGETSAQVELSREVPPNPHEKVFVIKGTAYQIHQVQHFIRIKVGDIPPGTPVPPFYNSALPVNIAAVGNSNPFGPGPTSNAQPQYAQWQQNGSQDKWQSQYYNAQNNIQPNYSTELRNAQQNDQQVICNVQPQQQCLSNNGDVNSQGNQQSISGQQPDYSAQWIEYYRNMGMHEQANLIAKNLEKKL